MQNYMLERLLERISVSQYKRNFILKGGFLISAIVGLDTRTTMDLDTTIKAFDLTHESLLEIFSEICEIQVEDDVKFQIERVQDLKKRWDKYRKDYEYAKDITYEDIMDVIKVEIEIL
jgi:predicted nucleotidyltransferase component of viral defense system